MTLPKARGVSRVADNAKVILVSFDETLTDDQMREMHDWLNQRRASEDIIREQRDEWEATYRQRVDAINGRTR